MVSVFKAGNLVALAVPKDIETLLEMDSWDFFLLFETEKIPKSKEFGYFMI